MVKLHVPPPPRRKTPLPAMVEDSSLEDELPEDELPEDELPEDELPENELLEEPSRPMIDWLWYQDEEAAGERPSEWDEAPPAERPETTDMWWHPPEQTTTGR
jgi:hypothetical protein